MGSRHRLLVTFQRVADAGHEGCCRAERLLRRAADELSSQRRTLAPLNACPTPLRLGSTDDGVSVLRRTEAEALRPQNGVASGSPDGFDALRFGPSGRRVWMMDTGYSDKDAALERARARMRSAAEISAS